MTQINIESSNYRPIPSEEIKARRIGEKNRKRMRRTTRMAMAATGITVALVAGGELLSNKDNPIKAKLRAELIAKARPTTNPSIVIEPYTVGNSPLDLMPSEVAADLHPMLADNQDAMDEILPLESYLDSDQPSFAAGQHLEIGVDLSRGIILPKDEVPHSAEPGS